MSMDASLKEGLRNQEKDLRGPVERRGDLEGPQELHAGLQEVAPNTDDAAFEADNAATSSQEVAASPQESSANHRQERCANCGRAAGPNYCGHCGQELRPHQGPFVAVTSEALSEWMSLDSRLLASLKALLRPGLLTELYMRGRRAPFLRPFRLYLLASLIVFSTALTLDVPQGDDLDISIGGELVGPASEGPVHRSLALLDNESLLGGLMTRFTGDRIDRLRKLPRQELLTILFSGLRRMLPLTLILFVPFLALGLKLLYVRGQAQHTLYLDHLIFALHYQSALFLALAATWLVVRIASFEPIGSALFYALTALAMLTIYLPLSLRRFYGQSRRWTAVKTLLLLFLYARLIAVAVDLSVIVAIWDV